MSKLEVQQYLESTYLKLNELTSPDKTYPNLIRWFNYTLGTKLTVHSNDLENTKAQINTLVSLPILLPDLKSELRELFSLSGIIVRYPERSSTTENHTVVNSPQAKPLYRPTKNNRGGIELKEVVRKNIAQFAKRAERKPQITYIDSEPIYGFDAVALIGEIIDSYLLGDNDFIFVGSNGEDIDFTVADLFRYGLQYRFHVEYAIETLARNDLGNVSKSRKSSGVSSSELPSNWVMPLKSSIKTSVLSRKIKRVVLVEGNYLDLETIRDSNFIPTLVRLHSLFSSDNTHNLSGTKLIARTEVNKANFESVLLPENTKLKTNKGSLGFPGKQRIKSKISWGTKQAKLNPSESYETRLFSRLHKPSDKIQFYLYLDEFNYTIRYRNALVNEPDKTIGKVYRDENDCITYEIVDSLNLDMPYLVSSIESYLHIESDKENRHRRESDRENSLVIRHYSKLTPSWVDGERSPNRRIELLRVLENAPKPSARVKKDCRQNNENKKVRNRLKRYKREYGKSQRAMLKGIHIG